MNTIDGLAVGRYGIWTYDFENEPAGLIAETAAELDERGWAALWFPEATVREALSLAGFLLANTRRLVVINGIAQIGLRPAGSAYGGARLLAEAHPDRHVLGLGVGAPRAGVKPLAAMGAYLDELDVLAAGGPVRRVLAAYRWRMLELARDRSAGAHTYKVNVEHTARAREILGPDAFLGVEHAVLLETDPGEARSTARAHLAPYIAGPYNRAKFQALGYTEEDLSGGGSDRFVDDFVFWGDVETVTKRLGEHVAAGADHIGVQVIGTPPGVPALEQWRRLADALLDAN